MTLTIGRDSPKDPQAAALLGAGLTMMATLVPSDEVAFLTVDELCADNVHFFTARQSGDVVGCGALVLEDGYAEVRSMFVQPDARGEGVAAAILMRLEREAVALKVPVLRLETGDLLHDAVRLYARHGFVQRDAFGDYKEDPASIFMEKQLI